MALKLKLKQNDRLILGDAFLEVERVGLTTITVSVEAPRDVVIFKQRSTENKPASNAGKPKP